MGQEAPGTGVSPEVMNRAKESYERCCRHEQFLHQFYLNFLEGCPEAAPMFASSDFDRLTRLLRHAIGLLLIFPAQPAGETNVLTRIAERHSRRDLDVDPALYTPFVDSLVATVRQHDPEFTAEVDAAWRETLAEGVAYMRSRY